MKRLNNFLIIAVIGFSSQAHAGFFSRVVHFLANIPIIGAIVDDAANHQAHVKADAKINDLYARAQSCSPLETDPATGLTANDWISQRPQYPDWREMERMESVAQAASDYARSQSSQDKVEHCFAGCYIRKNLDDKSAALLGWMKELQDASDCDPNTHFEKADYSATVAGSIAGGKTDCSNFCARNDLQSMTGDEMLAAANDAGSSGQSRSALLSQAITSSGQLSSALVQLSSCQQQKIALGSNDLGGYSSTGASLNPYAIQALPDDQLQGVISNNIGAMTRAQASLAQCQTSLAQLQVAIANQPVVSQPIVAPAPVAQAIYEDEDSGIRRGRRGYVRGQASR